MKPLKTLTIAESDRLLNSLKSHRDHLLALLMLDAGLRVGEAVQLQRPYLYIDKQPATSITLPPNICKRSKSRTVPTTPRLREAITKAETHTWFRPLNGQFPWVFPSRNSSKHLSVRQARNIIRHASEKAIGRVITPHALRHTFATRLMRVTSIRIVQELLGHSNIKSTQIYTHPNQQDMNKAIDKLGTNS